MPTPVPSRPLFGAIGLPQIAQTASRSATFDAIIAFYDRSSAPSRRTPADFANQEASYRQASLAAPYELENRFRPFGRCRDRIDPVGFWRHAARDFLESWREGMHPVRIPRRRLRRMGRKKLNAVGYENRLARSPAPRHRLCLCGRAGDPLLIEEFLEYPASGDATEPLPD